MKKTKYFAILKGGDSIELDEDSGKKLIAFLTKKPGPRPTDFIEILGEAYQVCEINKVTKKTDNWL